MRQMRFCRVVNYSFPTAQMRRKFPFAARPIVHIRDIIVYPQIWAVDPWERGGGEGRAGVLRVREASLQRVRHVATPRQDHS